jgi:hypothetical protein
MDLSEFGNWKNIEGYANYLVSDRGFVMNKKTLRILQPATNLYGYHTVNLYEGKVGKTCTIHSLVAKAHIDNPNGYNCVDHIDHDKTNNFVENLRWCSSSQNSMNKSKQANTSSNYKGVYWNKQAQKWHVQIQVDGKKKYIGLFLSEIQAAIAYNNASICYFAEFACLNVIPLDSITAEN